MDSLVACIDTCYECDSTILNPSKWFKMVKPGVSDGSTRKHTQLLAFSRLLSISWIQEIISRRFCSSGSARSSLFRPTCRVTPVTPVTPSALFQRCFAIFQELRWRWVPSLTIEIIWTSWPLSMDSRACENRFVLDSRSKSLKWSMRPSILFLPSQRFKGTGQQ